MRGKTYNYNSYVATADDMVTLLKVFDYKRNSLLNKKMIGLAKQSTIK